MRTRRDAYVALAYLAGRTLTNRVVHTAKRLRQPRYLLGALAGTAYFGALAWFFAGGGAEAPDSASAPPVETWVRPGLALLVVAWWVGGKSHTALAFHPAEVQFLFQAPVPRTVLVQKRLAWSQPGLLVTAFFIAIVGRGYVEIGFVALLVTSWLVATTLHLHQIAAALSRSSLAQEGARTRLRSWLGVSVFGLWAAGLVAALLPWLPLARAAPTFADLWLSLVELLSSPPLTLLLLPIDVLVAPFFATDGVAWALALTGTVGLLALHYVWLQHTDAAFEESAADAGEEAAALLSAAKEGRLLAHLLARRGRLPAPWVELPADGLPAMAIVWKNFTAFTRMLRPAFVLLLVVLFVGVYGLLRIDGDPVVAGLGTAGALGAIVGYSLIFGPMVQRNDLRSDLLRAEMLRSYPLDSTSLVAAEVAASTLSLTAAQAAFLGLALVFVVIAAPPLPWAGLPALAYVGALVLLLPINAIGLGIQNLLAVTFPRWYQLGPQAQQGLEGTGGQLVLMIVTALAMAIAYAAPFVFAAGITLLLWPAWGVAAAAPAAAAAFVVLAGEVVVLVALLARAYEALDPVEAGLLT